MVDSDTSPQPDPSVTCRAASPAPRRKPRRAAPPRRKTGCADRKTGRAAPPPRKKTGRAASPPQNPRRAALPPRKPSPAAKSRRNPRRRARPKNNQTSLSTSPRESLKLSRPDGDVYVDVGAIVQVYWDMEGKWFSGDVVEIDTTDNTYKVHYFADNEQHWHTQDMKIRVLV